MLPSWLPSASNELVSGAVDSISFHRTATVIFSDRAILTAVGKCVAVNVFLLLGSIAVYEKAVMPFLDVLEDRFVPPEEQNEIPLSTISKILTIFYTTFWLIPMWGLCYALSLQWYQDIAAKIHAKNNAKKSKPKPADVKDRVLSEVYVTLVWFLLFILLHVFLTLVPVVLGGISDSLTVLSANLKEGSHISYMVLVMRNLNHFIAVSSRFAGNMAMSALYGWYAFDYYWALNGDLGNKRFERVERHWAYFLGFGLPYLIVVRSTSFLVGYGIYLMVFPFTIILASECSYSIKSSASPPAIRLFSIPKLAADTVLGAIFPRSDKARSATHSSSNSIRPDTHDVSKKTK
jgi:hypothetical protein